MRDIVERVCKPLMKPVYAHTCFEARDLRTTDAFNIDQCRITHRVKSLKKNQKSKVIDLIAMQHYVHSTFILYSVMTICYLEGQCRVFFFSTRV